MAKNLKLKRLRSQTNWANVVLSLLLVPAIFGDDLIAIAQQKNSQYGLGLKLQQRGTLHVPPSYCIIAIVPKDGGRTLSHQPSLYFYLSKNKNYRNVSIFALRITMQLHEDQSVRRFRCEVKNLAEGLYKTALPVGNFANPNRKIQRWKIDAIDTDFSGLESTFVFVQQESNTNVLKEILPQSSILDKARIYAKYYYWYDAFDAYSQWLELYPNDAEARREREKMLQENLSSRCVDSYNYMSFKELLEGINVKSAKAISLVKK